MRQIEHSLPCRKLHAASNLQQLYFRYTRVGIRLSPLQHSACRPGGRPARRARLLSGCLCRRPARVRAERRDGGDSEDETRLIDVIDVRHYSGDQQHDWPGDKVNRQGLRGTGRGGTGAVRGGEGLPGL